MTTLQQWLDDFANKKEEEIAELVNDLGFKIDDLPIACLPIETMVRNYIDGKLTEDQLTPEGLEKYHVLHPKEDNTPHVDVFDFKAYFEDFLIFTRYYTGLELYLRAAIWISYKYEYIQTPEERTTLDDEFRENKKKREYLDSVTDTFEPRSFVEKWYQHFNPQKLQPGFIDYVMNKPRYLAHPDCIFNQLYRKYVDREWDTIAVLWFSQRDENPPVPEEKPKLTPRTLTKPKVTTPVQTPTNTYTAIALRKMTCPQLKEILKKHNAYKGCSKLTKEVLITKILAL